MLFIAMSPGNSLRAFAQASPPTDEDRPTVPMRKVQKLDFLYRASETYLTVGTGLDMMTTVHGLHHPTTASSASGVFLTHYYTQENGWARFVGKRDAPGVVLANVLLNTGIDMLDRKLYRRGGKWRAVAVTFNLLKGTDNMVCGFNNIHMLGGIDKVVQVQTGYKGLIVWSR
jgi:hypothetical protein